MSLQFWIQRPRLIIPRLRYWFWEVLNPGVPWLSAGAVTYCNTVLAKSMRVLEFGSGRSTTWFARRVGHITSIEHSVEWYRKVRADIDQNHLANVDYRLIPLDHHESEPEHEEYHPLPSYVGILKSFEDDSLDLVVVDGHYRTACIRACWAKLRAGGLLLVDDINWWGGPERIPVPSGWLLVHQSGNGFKRTAVWQKPHVPSVGRLRS